MKKKNATDSLNEAIELLQIKQSRELTLLKEQFHQTYENLKPINLIKGTWHDLTSAPDVKNDLVSSAIGLTTGYLSRKVLFGSSHNPIKNILGALLQFFIGNVVSKHSDTIKSTGGVILKSVFRNKKKDKHEFSNNGN